jgi:hypothetical protein
MMMPIYKHSAALAALIAKASLPHDVEPHIIDAIGLSEENLGQRRFAQELAARREWIAENCHGRHEIEPIRDSQMRLIRRRFKFADLNDATYFKLRWSGEVR